MPNVPEFLLRKLYVPESLKKYSDGFSFELNNSLASVTIVAFGLEADGKSVLPADITFQIPGENSVSATDLSTGCSFNLGVNTRIFVKVISEQVTPGRITFKVETREAGLLKFAVQTENVRSKQNRTLPFGEIYQKFKQKRRIKSVQTDPLHPRYHFTPPANWMNDPNGLIFWKGKTHLFYQYNPFEPGWGNMHWGHAVSTNLVHWNRLPVALTPTPGSADEDGCWSGCAVDNNGKLTLIYTAVYPETLCLAHGGEDLLTFNKFEGNPVIRSKPADMDLEGFRDPCVWKNEDGRWQMIIGAGLRGKGGAILLYESQDLVNWEYLHPALIGDLTQTEPFWMGRMWECPQLFRLGDRWILIISVNDSSNLLYTIYFVGSFQNGIFMAESKHKFDHGDESFYAPQTFIDGEGRRVLFGWIREERSDKEIKSAGWAGVLSLPRILALQNGGLWIEPDPQLSSLRTTHNEIKNIRLEQRWNYPIRIEDACQEFLAEINLKETTEFGMEFSFDPNEKEKIILTYAKHEQMLFVESNFENKKHQIECKRRQFPVQLSQEDILPLHIFMDRSILEIFSAGKVMTTRFYPLLSGSKIKLVMYGKGAILNRLDNWQMDSIWK
jgi:beta-fructofuranosidase